jgi:hypothetical protein
MKVMPGGVQSAGGAAKVKTCLVCVAWCIISLVGAQFPGSCQTLLDQDLKSELVFSAMPQGNLRYATQFAVIAPDEISVGEKQSGRVKHYKDGTSQSIAADHSVRYNAEFALLGIPIDPSFAENGYVYHFWSNADVIGGTRIDNRIARSRWNGMTLVEQSAPISLVPKDSTQGNGPDRQAGIITFGPVGKPLGATGDVNRGRSCLPIEQNASATPEVGTGGIFRINPDRSIPDEEALCRIRPFWTDTPPDAFAVSQETHLSGRLPQLAASNNLYYQIGSLLNPSQLRKPVVTEAQTSATFAQANISRLDLDVEGRNMGAVAGQELQLYDTVNQRRFPLNSDGQTAIPSV